MASDPRAQRLMDEFHEGATLDGGFNPRRGIAWVLRYLVYTEAINENWEAEPDMVPITILNNLANALEAPSLLDRAMAGDAQAARQFLYQAGFTDMRGQWLPQYQQETND